MVAEAPAAETVPAVVDEVDDESPDIPSPDGGPRRWRRTLLVWVGVLVAAWVLAFQLFAYQFDRWSLDPELRFIYQFACGFLGCELPAPPA